MVAPSGLRLQGLAAPRRCVAKTRPLPVRLSGWTAVEVAVSMTSDRRVSRDLLREKACQDCVTDNALDARFGCDELPDEPWLRYLALS